MNEEISEKEVDARNAVFWYFAGVITGVATSAIMLLIYSGLR